MKIIAASTFRTFVLTFGLGQARRNAILVYKFIQLMYQLSGTKAGEETEKETEMDPRDKTTERFRADTMRTQEIKILKTESIPWPQMKCRF